MKCRKKACNLGKNSSSLTPSRKANTPLKLTDEISCICCAVGFRTKGNFTTKSNHVDPGGIDDVCFGSKLREKSAPFNLHVEFPSRFRRCAKPIALATSARRWQLRK